MSIHCDHNHFNFIKIFHGLPRQIYRTINLIACSLDFVTWIDLLKTVPRMFMMLKDLLWLNLRTYWNVGIEAWVWVPLSTIRTNLQRHGSYFLSLETAKIYFWYISFRKGTSIHDYLLIKSYFPVVDSFKKRLEKIVITQNSIFIT